MSDLDIVLEAYRDTFGVKTEKANEIHRAACIEVSNLRDQEARNEVLENALQKLEAWTKAYPIEAFPEPDLKFAHQLLEAGGLTIDAVSASAMRHLLKRVKEIIEEALKEEVGNV